ncbi:Helix-turn-helix domain-containing protein [Kibdelosporangium persicum]
MTTVGTQPTGEPLYYLPSEVATMLRCSEWWVKEQARKRRIPFSWIGGGYRFTAEHIEQIVALFERRPTDEPATSASAQTHSRRPHASTGAQVTRLTARRPRRARRAAS